MNVSNYDLPPLPPYTLRPRDPLLPFISDDYLALALPIVAYWVVSFTFHIIDVYDWFPQYRLHTPAEVLQRNHVSRYEVFRDVIIQQIIQTAFGVVLTIFEPEATVGKEGYDVAVWAQRIRLAQRGVPYALRVVGLNAAAWSMKMRGDHPVLAGVLAGGRYPWLTQAVKIGGQRAVVPAFAQWEMQLAKALYWVVVPVVQFVFAICVVDTWQYFWHRAMHINKWLYTKFHSRHHRLYVPYAYGALYNHPFEGFLLDTLGAGLAYLISGMNTRQAIFFFAGSTIKTVDDHCGYALPWDPLQHLTSNNAGYHDIHHQSWGIKTNFSQPFFTFWDRIMGTMWTGGDVSARYEKAKLAAQRKADAANSISGTTASDSKTANLAPYTDELANASLPISAHAKIIPHVPEGKATSQAVASREQVLQTDGPSVIAEEMAEEREARSFLKRSTRKKSQQNASLKGLRERIDGTIAGKGGLPRVESSR